MDRPVGERPDVVTVTTEYTRGQPSSWEEHDMSPITKAEVVKMFDPNAITAYRKQQAQRFKPMPKPSRAQRLLNWLRRFWQ